MHLNFDRLLVSKFLLSILSQSLCLTCYRVIIVSEHMSFLCGQVKLITGQIQGRNLVVHSAVVGELITYEIHFLFSISWISTICPSYYCQTMQIVVLSGAIFYISIFERKLKNLLKTMLKLILKKDFCLSYCLSIHVFGVF